MFKKELVVSFVLLCCAGWASATVVDYVSYWAFDGNDSDASANAYNLASTSPVYNTGVAGQAAVFDETANTKRTISASSAPNIWGISTEMTVSFWLKPPSTQTAEYSFIFNIWNTIGGHRKILLYWWDDGTSINDIQMSIADPNQASSSLKDDNATPIRDVWYHVVLVVDLAAVGTDTYIYMTPYSSETIVLGNSKDSGLSELKTGDPGTTVISIADSFNGSIDEMAVYNRALSSDEIQILFDLGKNGQSIPEPASVTLLLAGLASVLIRRRKMA